MVTAHNGLVLNRKVAYRISPHAARAKWPKERRGVPERLPGTAREGRVPVHQETGKGRSFADPSKAFMPWRRIAAGLAPLDRGPTGFLTVATREGSEPAAELRNRITESKRGGHEVPRAVRRPARPRQDDRRPTGAGRIGRFAAPATEARAVENMRHGGGAHGCGDDAAPAPLRRPDTTSAGASCVRREPFVAARTHPGSTRLADRDESRP